MDISLRESTCNLVEDHFNEVTSSTPFRVVWQKLTHYWDFFNFELLQHVIESFAFENVPLCEDMNSYAAEVERFSCNTKVCEFFRDWPLRKNKPTKYIMKLVVVKTKMSWAHCTLQDVKNKSAALTQKFFLPNYVLVARDVKKGCVAIHWFTLPSVALLLIRNVRDIPPEFFQVNGFQFISVNAVRVYTNHDIDNVQGPIHQQVEGTNVTQSQPTEVKLARHERQLDTEGYTNNEYIEMSSPRSSTESNLPEVVLKIVAVKLARHERQLGEDSETILKQAVRLNAVDFRNCTDFKMLAVHLFAKDLVHPGEQEYLNSPYISQIQKANRFYAEILDRKGPEAYRSFYYALKGEKEHKGHEHLVELLEQALDK